MKGQESTTLRIFCLPQALGVVEWTSLLGDKFLHALPFTPVLESSLDAADVIVWDGSYTVRFAPYAERLRQRLELGKILLLSGEGQTLLQGQPGVGFIDLAPYRVVRLGGWGVLPEELISALIDCWNKLKHV